MTDVTVITPIYNTQDYLHTNIQSVLSQKGVDLKLILIDDGSVDNSFKIADYYSKVDKRVTVISQENKGQGPARNAAIDIADSEFIYFVDSDDSLGPNTLSKLTSSSRKYHLDICSPNVPSKYFNKRLELIGCLPCKSQFLRKSIIDNFEIRQPDCRSGQDGVFSHLYLTLSRRIGMNRDARFNYTAERPGSTFAKYKSLHSEVPNIVKIHMDSINNFYEKNDLWSRSSDRFLMFLANETFENRISPHFEKMTDLEMSLCIDAISPLFKKAFRNLKVFDRKNDKFVHSLRNFLDNGKYKTPIISSCEALKNNNFEDGTTVVLKYWNKNIAPESLPSVNKKSESSDYIQVSKKHMRDIESKLDFLINIVNNNSYMVASTLKRELPILDNQSNDLIVSLTTLPSRVNSLDLTLTSLLKQTVLPSKIIVWITDKIDRTYLSKNVLDFEGNGIEFRFINDVGPHTKLYYSLLEFPDSRVITVDDDIIYPPNTIKCLVSANSFSPMSICANWARELTFDSNGDVREIRAGKLLTPPILEKEIEQSTLFQHQENILAFPYGTSGVLYPPGCFNEAVLNVELFRDLSPKEDDIWFKACSMVNGTKVVVTNLGINPKHHCIYGSQEEALRHHNHALGGNKTQMNSVFKYFDIKGDNYL